MDKDLNVALNDKQEAWTIYNEINQSIDEGKRIVREYDFMNA